MFPIAAAGLTASAPRVPASSAASSRASRGWAAVAPTARTIAIEWTSRMSAASTTMSVAAAQPGVSERGVDRARGQDRRDRQPVDRHRGVADEQDLDARLRGPHRGVGEAAQGCGEPGCIRPRRTRSRRAFGRGVPRSPSAASNPGRSATIGRSRRSVRGPRGGPPSSAGRRPSSTRRSMTTRSRSGSMAGLVTWANAWRRWSAIGRSRRPRPAVGVSSPMLQSGSCASSAIVLMSRRARSASSPARKRAAWSSGGRRFDGTGRRVRGVLVERSRLVVDRQVAKCPGLRVGVLEDRPPAGLHEQQLPGSESPPTDRVCGGERNGPRLRRHGDEPVAVHGEGRRAQAVAVDERPDPLPVAEHDRSRPVPRRQHPGAPSTQRRDVRVRGTSERERLRDRREQRGREAPAGRRQQLQALVERQRVGAVRGQQRTRGGELGGDRPATDVARATAHLLAIPAHGVDLAVVGDGAERLRQPPDRTGVRRVPLVEDRVADLDGCAQVRVELGQTATGDQALVDDRPTRRRGHGQLGHGTAGVPGGRLQPASGNDEAPLERVIGDGAVVGRAP